MTTHWLTILALLSLDAAQADSLDTLEPVHAPSVSVALATGVHFPSLLEPTAYEGGLDPSVRGLALDWAELGFNSQVDRVLEARLYLAGSPSGIRVFEAWAGPLILPKTMRARVGLLPLSFGRVSHQRPQERDWIRLPIVSGRFFGGSGLQTPGLQWTWTTPLPYFCELTLAVQSAAGSRAASFMPARVDTRSWVQLGDPLVLARLRNTFQFTEESRLDWGGSIATGPNESDTGARTTLVGVELAAVSIDAAATSGWEVSTEIMQRWYGSSSPDWGAWAQALWTMAPLGLGARVELVGPRSAPVSTTLESPDRDAERRMRISPLLRWTPSKWSVVRLEYDLGIPSPGASMTHGFELQVALRIGEAG